MSADVSLDKLDLEDGDIITTGIITMIDNNSDKIQTKINATDNKIGDLSGLTTTDKTSVINAIVENTTKIATNTQNIATNTQNIASHATELSDVAHKTGVVQTNLNSDKVDGYDVGSTSGTIPYYDTNGNITPSTLTAKLHNENLIYNPSFRFGTATSSDGWTGIGSNGFGIIAGGNGEGAYLYNSTTQSSMVQVNSNGSKYKCPANAGVQYTLSCEMYTGGVTSGSVWIQWYAFNSSDVSLSGGSISATNGAGWTKYSVTFTTPTNTSTIMVSCGISASTTNTGCAWRKLKLESGSVATAFSDDSTFNEQYYNKNTSIMRNIGSTGAKVQTGTGSISVTANTVANITITFPTAFSSTPNIVVSLQNVSTTLNNTFISLSAVSTTGANGCAISATTQTIPFTWIAIGS